MTRQGVVDAIKAAVSATGINAFEWLAAGLTASQMPAVVIRDTEGEVKNELYHAEHTLTVEATCLTSGSNAPADCRMLMHQMAGVIGGAVTGCRLIGSRLTVEHDDTALAAGTLIFEVPYATQPNEV